MRTNKENNPEHQSDISKMLAALPRADAPANFDHRVKARIAAGRSGAWSPFAFFPALKIAIPVILLLAMGAYMLMPGLFYTGGGEVRTAGSQPTPSPEEPVAEMPFTTQDEQETAGTDKDTTPVAADEQKAEFAERRESRAAGPGRQSERHVSSKPAEAAKEQETGHSKVLTTTTPDELIVATPEPDGDVADPKGAPGFDNLSEFKPAEILALMGVKAEFGTDGWKVTSVDPLGAGMRSGIRSGDVIEAIDGVSLKDDTVFRGPLTVRSVRIRRAGESLNISLQN